MSRKHRTLRRGAVETATGQVVTASSTDDQPTVVAALAREGYALLEAPDDVGGCSVGGQEYSVNEDGLVEVPVACVAALQEHGFVTANVVVATPAPTSAS